MAHGVEIVKEYQHCQFANKENTTDDNVIKEQLKYCSLCRAVVFSRSYTARNVIGYWHHTVVCLSV